MCGCVLVCAECIASKRSSRLTISGEHWCVDVYWCVPSAYWYRNIDVNFFILVRIDVKWFCINASRVTMIHVHVCWIVLMWTDHCAVWSLVVKWCVLMRFRFDSQARRECFAMQERIAFWCSVSCVAECHAKMLDGVLAWRSGVLAWHCKTLHYKPQTNSNHHTNENNKDNNNNITTNNINDHIILVHRIVMIQQRRG